jgi:hypothetical protein
MEGRSGELVTVEILSLRGDFTWAVGRGPCGPVCVGTSCFASYSWNAGLSLHDAGVIILPDILV